MRRWWGYRHITCCLLVVVLLTAHAQGAWGLSTVEVSQGGPGPVSLIQALQDQDASTIVLGGDYSVASELPGPLPAAVLLQRNVTIEGKAGADPPVTLDLAFRRAVVTICPTCSVTLKNLILKNARRGSGAALDFFVGDDDPENGFMVLENVHRLRLACTPGSDTAEVLNSIPRSKILPPSATGKQMFSVKTITFQGKTYPNALRLVDFTQDLPLVHQEGRGHASTAHFGGYALGSRNVLYLCENEVSEACLAEKSPDACVNELIDSVLAQRAHKPGSVGGVLLAAIIAPIVVVGALLSVLAVWLLHRRRQQQRHRKDEEEPEGKLHYPSNPYSFSPSNGTSGGLRGPPGSSVNGLDSASDVYSHSFRSKSQAGRRSLEVAMQPRGQQQGWQLVSSATAADVELPEGSDNVVEFGAFLGAGSYGRVYRARWAGRHIACKVIQHDRSTMAAVEAEASLMVSLHHPNVVKAYHYSTFAYTEPDPASSDKGRGSRIWATGAPLGNQRQSVSDSQSSGGSRQLGPAADSAQQLARVSAQPPQTNSASNSGSGARMLLLRQQQQQQAAAAAAMQQGLELQREESSDVLVTNLSLDAAGAQEAAAATLGVLGAAGSRGSSKGSADAKGSGDGGGNVASGQSGEEQGRLPSGVKHKAETWLVQEYCDLGTLGGIASAWDVEDECDEQMLERLQLLRDTAEGLEALHNNHVVHGDVNARNVLVSSSSSSPLGMSAKVADLGLSRCLAHQATHRTTNSCGTMSHMAPELLRYGRLSPAVDTYAIAIMMWELYNQGQPAFDKLHYGQFFETIVLRKVRPCVPAGMPPDYELLMRQCWAADPAERPTAAVLRQCLQLLVEDRQRRVDAATAALAGSVAGSDAASAPSLQLPPSGVDTLAALRALLPAQHRRASPAVGPATPHGLQQVATSSAAGAAAVGNANGVQVTPGNSSTPLSVVSLSALFPDPGTPQENDTVLFIGDEAAGPARVSADGAAALTGAGAAAPAGAGAGKAAAPAAAASAQPVPSRPAVSRRSAGAAGSPLGEDLESQLDKDPSVHNSRLWFV